MPKVSVIIPVYNNEMYIRQCLDNAVSQTERDIEIIVIDDGSTDSSPAICDEYEKRDERITVIHELHGGVSKARNTGIKIAKGEYILFLDSDDYIKQDCIEKVYGVIKQSNADIIIWNYSFVEDDKATPNIDFPFGTHYCGVDYKDRLIATALCPLISGIETPGMVFLGMGFVWNKLFRTDVVKNNNIYFENNVAIYEDVVFVCRYLELTKSIIITDERLHYHRVNEKGATLRFKPGIVESNKLLIEALGQTLNMESKIINDGYYSRIIRCLSDAAKYYCFHKEFKGNRFAALRDCVNSCSEYRKAIEEVNKAYLTKKQRVLFVLLRLCAK